MADKLGLGTEIRELKLGPSFTNNKSTSFHTIRYDFKPASVDLAKVANVDVGSGNQVTVTVPHLDGAGTSHTIFKGSQRPYQKECVLIIDRTTGEITLEKLSNNIQVKKTRMETVQKVTPPFSHPNSRNAFDMPSNLPEKLSVPLPQQRSKSKKKTSPKSHQPTPSLSGCIPRHSPLHASPPYPTHSPTRPQHKSPPQSNPPRSTPVPPSLPVIGMDDSSIGFGNTGNYGSHSQQQLQPEVSRPPRHSPEYENNAIEQDEIGILPDSSSSDSSSGSASSDSDSEPDMKPISRFNSSPLNSVNGHMNGTASPSLSMPDHLLKEDLQLSESGSESD